MSIQAKENYISSERQLYFQKRCSHGETIHPEKLLVISHHELQNFPAI
jgi:hypothetical protein